MQLRAEQLDQHLAGRGGASLAALYVVHGDEPLLALEAADAVRGAARRAGYGEREVFVAERGFDWTALLHAAASRSLFAARRLIELRIPGGRPGVQGAEAIQRYCGRLDPDALTLVSLPRLDRAGQSSAWFGALCDAGVRVDIYPVDRARLPAWIGERLARQGQRAARPALEFLAARVEGNLLAAHQEVQKLALLAPAGELSLEAVSAAVADVARYDAWGASEALLAGDLARYARVVTGLRGEGEAPTLAVWAIGTDLRALLRIQHGLANGRPLDALVRESRVWGSRQEPLRAATRRYRPAAVRRALRRAAAADRAAKGVARADPWDRLLALGLELMHGSQA